MNMVYVTPDNPFSRSAHEIRILVGKDECKFIKDKTAPYEHSKDKFLINWGCKGTHVSGYAKDGPVINPTAAIKKLDNRMGMYNTLTKAGINNPGVLTAAGAEKIMDSGGKVLSRFRTRKEEASDIIFLNSTRDVRGVSEIQDYFLTEYIPKTVEYRLHVFDRNVIAQEAKTTLSVDDAGKEVEQKFLDWRIRTRRNGFIWKSISDKQIDKTMTTMAIESVQSIKDLTFGAVVLIYSMSKDKYTVVDIESAPVIYDEEVSKAYADSIRRMAK